MAQRRMYSKGISLRLSLRLRLSLSLNLSQSLSLTKKDPNKRIYFVFQNLGSSKKYIMSHTLYDLKPFSYFQKFWSFPPQTGDWTLCILLACRSHLGSIYDFINFDSLPRQRWSPQKGIFAMVSVYHCIYLHTYILFSTSLWIEVRFPPAALQRPVAK
jgi:hypothetical protein